MAAIKRLSHGHISYHAAFLCAIHVLIGFQGQRILCFKDGVEKVSSLGKA